MAVGGRVVKELSRRGFVVAASLAGLSTAARAFPSEENFKGSGGGGSSASFRHGVASGDPLHDRVIIWTRVSPRRSNDSVLVKWRIARDSRMKREECGGRVWTDASRDFTVKVDVDHLDPNRTYYYQFEVQGGFGGRSARSPIGRTKTLPLFHARSLRFAVASCSNYPYGFFQVYRRIAERADLDFVLHLGDYIYEYANGQYGDGASIGRLVAPDHEIVSLQDYRQRHATYKTDLDLQEAHRQHPFIAVWDDHESANDSWHDGAENHNPELGEGAWDARKRAAIRAYFEWMPIREFPYRPKSSIYRAFRFGNLAEIDMLDTRLFGRDHQAASAVDVATINDPSRQLLGAEQENWLFSRLYRSQYGSPSDNVRWRVLGQQVMMAQLSATRGAQVLNVDAWDGYAPARERLFRHIADHNIDNVVVLTGDIHSSWGSDLTSNPWDAAKYDPATGRGSVGVELVTPGVTSPGIENPTEAAQTAIGLRALSPHMKFIELNKRGYVLVDIDRDRVQSEWWQVPTIRERTNVQALAARLASESGANNLKTASVSLQMNADAAELAPIE
jgi:alkaline phosphatase D